MDRDSSPYTENSEYQKQVIELHTQLIDNNREHLDPVKSFVEAELRSFSDSVQSTVEIVTHKLLAKIWFTFCNFIKTVV